MRLLVRSKHRTEPPRLATARITGNHSRAIVRSQHVPTGLMCSDLIAQFHDRLSAMSFMVLVDGTFGTSARATYKRLSMLRAELCHRWACLGGTTCDG